MASMMAAVDPDSIRTSERRQAGLFRINGVDLDPLDQTRAWGMRLFRYRSEVTVKAIRAAIAATRRTREHARSAGQSSRWGPSDRHRGRRPRNSHRHARRFTGSDRGRRNAMGDAWEPVDEVA